MTDDPHTTVRLIEAFENLPVGALGTLLDRFEELGGANVEFFDPVCAVMNVPLSIIEEVTLDSLLATRPDLFWADHRDP